jgi:hypothetical protein
MMKPSKEAVRRYEQQQQVRKSRNKLESKRQKAILDYMNGLGWPCKFYLSRNACGEADLHGSYCGYYLAIEVKRPGQQLTPLQESEGRGVRETGGFSFRAESVKDVKKQLVWINKVVEGRRL